MVDDDIYALLSCAASGVLLEANFLVLPKKTITPNGYFAIGDTRAHNVTPYHYNSTHYLKDNIDIVPRIKSGSNIGFIRTRNILPLGQHIRRLCIVLLLCLLNFLLFLRLNEL